LLNLIGFNTCDTRIELGNCEGRKKIDQQTEKELRSLYVYNAEESVKGTVFVRNKPGQKIEFTSVKIEFIGEIELIYDRGNRHDFTSLKQDVFASPGTIREDCGYEFNFENAEKNCDSYNGLNVRLRYLIRFTIARKFAPNIVKEQEIWVINYGSLPDLNPSIKMEVGIEDCLHIEFEYARSKYHLKDVVIGKIFFLLVRINIKYMEIALIKKETTGTGPNVYNESETITKYEVMDGSPVKGESIPIRLFLSGFDLTPTYKNIHNKFSVKYFLNLVLVDEEDRRYFKQTDINLWRKKPGETENTPQNNMVRMKDEKRKKRKKKTNSKEDEGTKENFEKQETPTNNKN